MAGRYQSDSHGQMGMGSHASRCDRGSLGNVGCYLASEGSSVCPRDELGNGRNHQRSAHATGKADRGQIQTSKGAVRVIKNFLNMSNAEYLAENKATLARLIEQGAHPALIQHWQERVATLEAQQ